MTPQPILSATTDPPARMPRASGWLARPEQRHRILALFLIALLIPATLNLAGMRLDPYRIVLLVLIVPLGIAWLSGRGGRITGADIALLGYSLWLMGTLILHHGADRIPFAGMTAVELFGGYILGRMLIRSEADYRLFIRYFLIALAVLAPVAVIELLTGRMPVADLLAPFVAVTQKIDFDRLGLSRVQAGFAHPILFGLFCSLLIANVFYLYRDRIAKLMLGLGLGAGMTFLSLSAAPLMSVMLQVALGLWEQVTRGRWWLLLGIAVAGYVVIDLLSNRNPITILISMATFSAHTAWYRILIWDHGTAEVLRHPLVGIGLNDWSRPAWMHSGTVDNFWLLTAMRHGLPGLGLVLGGIAWHAAAMIRLRGLSAGEKAVRLGHLVALAGTVMTLSTVHIWDELLSFVMFYIGAGAFLYSAPRAAAVGAPPDEACRRDRPLRRAPPAAPDRGRVDAPPPAPTPDIAPAEPPHRPGRLPYRRPPPGGGERA